jgi:hypothetical protein
MSNAVCHGQLLKSGVGIEKGTISASTADEHSMTYGRISLLKFPQKSHGANLKHLN